MSAKLSEGITMLVKVLRFIKTKIGGLRVEKSSRNITFKLRDQFCQYTKVVWLNQRPGDPPGIAQAGRVGCPATEIVFGSYLSPILSC